MDYAELILRLGENRVYRITEPCEVVVAGNENILNAAALEVGTNTCIEARRLVFRYPGAEDLLMTLHVYTQHRVHAFRDDSIILARIEYDPIEENDRINCLQRTVLPLVDLRQNFVGYPRNQTL